jgi:hypothetical protein
VNMPADPSDWTFGRGAPRGPDGLGLGRKKWADGWDREARCPKDPKADSAPGMEPWRSCSLTAGRAWWLGAHDARRKAVRSLRRAGYDARKLYGRKDNGWRQHGRHMSPSWVYTDGPAEGLEAVDPWVRAAQLSSCSAKMVAQPRVGANGEPRMLPMPIGCGQHHVCPVCAARRSRHLAAAVRAYVGDARSRPCSGCSNNDCDGQCSCLGDVALVTLTHRDRPGESLHAELERWRRAWRLMMRGRSGRRLRRYVLGWYYGIEVTRGAAWWHVHAHVIVGLRAGVDHDTARRVVAMAWQNATDSASRTAAGHEHWGWDPYSGCHVQGEAPSTTRVRMESGDYAGGWWREIPADDDRMLHEACKYPTPVAELEPLHLVEFLSASHGRRWHEGGWSWRSIRAEGDQLGEELRDEEGCEDIGIPIASLAPGDCPPMEDIAPGWGACEPEEPDPLLVQAMGQSTRRRALPQAAQASPADGSVRWVLLADPALAELAEVWAAEGWCEVGSMTRTELVPCKADHPDAAIRMMAHPSGQESIVYCRAVQEQRPILTMTAARAARLVQVTEAAILSR